ncbi:MAG: OmpA family protein [Flavobacteriales bacterium]|nr:OmpA family protein [Flavobacteriales bacterium]
MKKFNILFGILFFGINLNAQDNLVPNPSFEEVNGRIKEGGLIEMAFPWKSVTMNPVDLYSESAKSDDFAVPENAYGVEKANTGSNYAGVSFFGFAGRMPRTYLGTPLTKPLEAGKSYCMKFHVSMADYSKYAVNNLGIYVTKEELTEKTDGILEFVPQIKSLKNEAFDKQFLWTAICGIFEAEGGEQFITIGNFNTDASTQQEKVRLSREFMGKRQQNNAYYYIDDVSVVELTEKTKADCLCDKIAGGVMKTEFKSFGTDKDKRAAAKKTYIVNSDGTKATEGVKKTEPEAFSLGTAILYFDDKADEPNAASQKVLEQIVAAMSEDVTTKIMITGHIDASESGVSLLAKKRAFNIRKMLRAMGIDDTRLAHESKEATMPKDKEKPELNRRVTINLK